jgi:outer membrane protein
LQRNVFTGFADAKGALNVQSAIIAVEARQGAYDYAKKI